MARRIALVSIADHSSTLLAKYLRESGFDVHVCEELAIGSAFSSLVLLAHEMPADAVRSRVRRWLKGASTRKIVVVTPRPAAFEQMRAAHHERLFVFAPPIFGWDVVDVLRGVEPRRPRGA